MPEVLLYGSLARKDGSGISAAQHRVAGRLRVPRSTVNMQTEVLREAGWLARDRTDEIPDQHRLTLPAQR